jgi:alpha-beta hydrolase superfamily lysophospholipase
MKRIRSTTIALSIAMTSFASFGAEVTATTIQQDVTGGNAFYVPPTPLPWAEHGAVIRMKPLISSAALPSAGRNLLILYHSRTLDGQDVAVSGTLAIPAGTPPAGGWPVITWTHGTTGLAAACMPSLDTPQGPQHDFLTIQQTLLDGYVSRGYAVVATDYQGLGTPGMQPFLQGVAEGRGALDIISAAREIEPAIGTRYVSMGHSQGGHAALFTAAIGSAYAPELQLLASVAFAPASHIGETITSMTRASTGSLRLSYAMYVLQSFASNHPDVDLSKILSAQALKRLPETLQACITATASSGYWSTAIPGEQFVPGADLSPILKIAASNEPDGLHIEVPTFIAQGTSDDTVVPAWTDEVANALCKNGTPLFYATLPGADHEQVVAGAAGQARAWIETAFARGALQSNCTELPTAGPR